MQGILHRTIFKKDIKIKIYKYLSVFFTIIILLNFPAYSDLKIDKFLNDSDNIDATQTYSDFESSDKNILNDKLIVVGDSFSYFLVKYSSYDFNYTLHQGFVLESICDNLIDPIPDGKYKFCFLFIGPNDFMSHTVPVFFQKKLYDIVNKLKVKGITTIFTDYLEPNLYDERCNLLISGFDCSFYDGLIKDICVRTNSLYVPSRDLFLQYRWMDNDFIHPNESFYKPLMDRVIDRLRDG